MAPDQRMSAWGWVLICAVAYTLAVASILAVFIGAERLERAQAKAAKRERQPTIRIVR